MSEDPSYQKMTLRDVFAASYLTGMSFSAWRANLSREKNATEAYEMADAMLEARKQKEPQP